MATYSSLYLRHSDKTIGSQTELKYLSEISETLETETDREVTASLLSTAVTELCSQIKGLLKWRKLSFIAERLLQDADFDTLAIFFNDTID